MLKYYILAAVLVNLGTSLSLTVQHPKQRFIKEIKEGPYQNYSGQPLVDLGGKLYYFETNVASTWAEASSFCRSLGLFLVSIEDATENGLIENYILTNIGPKYFWTSGSDSAHEGSFVWASTGNPFIYTSWDTGEPNNDKGVEDVVMIFFKSGDLLWNDTIPTLSNVFAICEEEI